MKVEGITIHHSLTKDSGTVSWNAIRKYHKEEKGWRDIGYHYGIELVNDHYEIFVGRFENQDGAHTKGWNSTTLGICMLGNFDIAVPCEKQMNVTIRLVRSLIYQYDLRIYNVGGHRERSYEGILPSKTCPGSKFNMNLFRRALA